ESCIVARRKGGAVVSTEELLVRRASSKIQEGDIRGAVRCINSDESLAPMSADTLRALETKHPPTPSDRRPSPAFSTAPQWKYGLPSSHSLRVRLVVRMVSGPSI